MNQGEHGAVHRTLVSNPLFEDVPDGELRDIESHAEMVVLEKMESLDWGGSTPAFYIVAAGLLQLSCPTAPNTTIGLRQNDAIAADPVSTLFVALAALSVEASQVLRIPWTALDSSSPRLSSIRARIAAEASRHLLRLHLSSVDIFRSLDDAALSRVAADSEMIPVRRGEIVIHEGQNPDYFYVVVRGSLEVFRERQNEARSENAEDAAIDAIDLLNEGDCVGEMGVLLQEPRSASVRARRDSLLIRVSGACFEHILHRDAELTLRLARTLSERLKRTTISATRKIPLKTIALYKYCEQPVFDTFCRRLSMEFQRAGNDVALLLPSNVEERRHPSWLRDEEARHDYVLCACDESVPEWSARSVRQADLILFVGMSGASAPLGKLPEATEAARESGARVELALLRERNVIPNGTGAWLDSVAYDAHHHLVVDSQADFERLARRLSGKAWGLVLGGGGARGLAHIGAIRALREGGIPIDMIAGTSMGAILAAQYAMGYDFAEMLACTRRAYVGGSGWGDLTLPLVSLRSGRGTFARLHEIFGELRIEDLPIPYFCVSCNLTRATPVIHDRGLVAMGTRVSCSVPGLLPPVPWDGDLLVDGALLNNLPVDEMKKRVRGPVAASDVSVAVDLAVSRGLERETSWSGLSQILSKVSRRPGLPNIVNLLMRMAEIGSVRDSKVSGSPADLYLQLPVGEYAMTDFDAIDRIVQLGYEYTVRRLSDPKARLAG